MKAFLAAASLFAIPIAGAQVPTGSAPTFPPASFPARW